MGSKVDVGGWVGVGLTMTVGIGDGIKEGAGTAAAGPARLEAMFVEKDPDGGPTPAPLTLSDPGSVETGASGPAPPASGSWEGGTLPIFSGGLMAAWVSIGIPEVVGEAALAQPPPARTIETRVAMYANFRINSYRRGIPRLVQRMNHDQWQEFNLGWLPWQVICHRRGGFYGTPHFGPSTSTVVWRRRGHGGRIRAPIHGRRLLQI